MEEEAEEETRTLDEESPDEETEDKDREEKFLEDSKETCSEYEDAEDSEEDYTLIEEEIPRKSTRIKNHQIDTQIT